MNPVRYPKRLVEVDLPIRDISTHARREKSIRQGHLSTLHIWWARRPLAACRAIICASLWPDPADESCPEEFVEAASELLGAFGDSVRTNRAVAELCSHHWATWNGTKYAELSLKAAHTRETLRQGLLNFIADFSNWDASTEPAFLETASALTRAAHLALTGSESRPVVLDPFAGGGTIPLEALRVGADAVAGDLNPVAHFVQRLTLQEIPSFGEPLIGALKAAAETVRKALEPLANKLYGAPSKDGRVAYAWFWARSIRCTGPGCGIQIPIARQFWLAREGKNKAAVQLVSKGPGKELEFKVVTSPTARDVPPGTTRRGKVTCPACQTTLKQAEVQKIANAKGIDEVLMAVADVDVGGSTKTYRAPTASDRELFLQASKARRLLDDQVVDGLSVIPNEPFPYLRSILNPHVYGFHTWGSLFNSRQALLTAELVKQVRALDLSRFSTGKKPGFDRALRLLLGTLLDRQLTFMSSFSRWAPKGQHPVPPFSNNGFPMVWDYVEINPFAGAAGAWKNNVDWIERVGAHLAKSTLAGEATVILQDARVKAMPDESVALAFTDPPYYDAVPYANLSDFFYVWLRRSLYRVLPDVFAGDLSPKDSEIVQLAGRCEAYEHKTKAFFEAEMGRSFSAMREVVAPGGLACFVFAHKGTDAWEALLQSVLTAGWQVVASWPIDTERTGRVRANNAAALGSSIHLICRRRETNTVGEWRQVLQELPPRVTEWVQRLAEEGVVGADAIFACLGPALEIYSRYTRVEKASGESVALREYLEHVWAAVAQEALSLMFQGADASGLEEDARLTAMWLWTLQAGDQSTPGAAEEPDEEDSDEEVPDDGGEGSALLTTLEFDAARKIAQGLGAHLEKLPTIVEVKGDKARLLSVGERARFLFVRNEPSDVGGRGKKSLGGKRQLGLFAEVEAAERDGLLDSGGAPKTGESTLDRLHQAMILFATGRSEALKRFLVEGGVGKDVRFWRLAHAFSALYPSTSEEKRWVDGVLSRKKSLGF